MFQALAPAKVNLFLHVGPVDASDYHPLVSLVAFADVGDRLTVERAKALSLDVTGPFGAGLAAEADNLVLRAVKLLGETTGIGESGLRIVLDKQLPIAAGLGGGSSDAGAALKLARRALDLDIDDAGLEAIAARIGADGPMCLLARPVWAEGRGDRLTDAPDLPPLHAVLVNPGAPSPTGPVYRAYDDAPVALDPRPAPPKDWSPGAVIDWLARQRNDLQSPAIALTPVIGQALAAVSACPGVGLTRMSGSGATVFGLFENPADATAAAAAISRDQGHWWVRATVLGADAAASKH